MFITRLLARRRSRLPKRSEPIHYPPVMCAGKEITTDELNELQYYLTLGIHYREQTEYLAARCCEILGVDPRDDCSERDWANEIVHHGTDPALVIERINHLNQEAAS